MSTKRLLRTLVVAGIVATTCVFGGLEISAGVVLLGHVGALLLPRRTNDEYSGFGAWFVCTLAFAATSLALLPFAPFSTVNIGLAVFSPVFGIVVYVIEALVS